MKLPVVSGAEAAKGFRKIGYEITPEASLRDRAEVMEIKRVVGLLADGDCALSRRSACYRGGINKSWADDREKRGEMNPGSQRQKGFFVVTVGLFVWLTSCSRTTPESVAREGPTASQAERDSLFEKKLRCAQLRPSLEGARANQGWQIESVFYSAQLNSCVLTKSLVEERRKAAILQIQDALTGSLLFVDANAYGKPVDEFNRRVEELKKDPKKSD